MVNVFTINDPLPDFSQQNFQVPFNVLKPVVHPPIDS
jgi:hypothetical protein